MKLFRLIISLIFLSSPFALLHAQNLALTDSGEVVACVNDEDILLITYRQAQQRVLNELREKGLTGVALENKLLALNPLILKNLIDQQLLLQQAEKLSIKLSAEEIYNANFIIGKDSSVDEKVLKAKFLTDKVVGQEIYQKIINSLTLQEKHSYYQQHPEYFITPAKFNVRIVSIPIGKTPLKSLRYARQFVAQIKTEYADFHILAQSYVANFGAKYSGLVKDLALSECSEEIRQLISNAVAGTVYDPIRILNYYQIFWVEERHDGDWMKFESPDVQELIKTRMVIELGAAQVAKYLSQLRSNSNIYLNPKYQ